MPFLSPSAIDLRLAAQAGAALLLLAVFVSLCFWVIARREQKAADALAAESKRVGEFRTLDELGAREVPPGFSGDDEADDTANDEPPRAA